jgi:hypothetical protein
MNREEMWDRDQILRCCECKKLTTGIEAMTRVFNTDLCPCGGQLKKIKKVKTAKKEMV